MSPVSDAVFLLRGLFMDVPGTRMSVRDAARLSGLDDQTCASILAAFEDAHFIQRSARGGFVRSSDGAVTPSVMHAIV